MVELSDMIIVTEHVQQQVILAKAVALVTAVEVIVMYHKLVQVLVTIIVLVAVLVHSLKLVLDALGVLGQAGRLYQVVVHRHQDVAMGQFNENVKLVPKNVFVRKYRRKYDN